LFLTFNENHLHSAGAANGQLLALEKPQTQVCFFGWTAPVTPGNSPHQAADDGRRPLVGDIILAGALTHDFCYQIRAVASRNLLPVKK
jgi:hypothetical protein